ncbi:RsmB/NOP family class I SAM-dependent RNA methyltransferase [Luteolibacter ambystomatis]|uniref:RsmB/NOP family class I SAM-dependent RNA methyltransferase n=1 Tax=Luteolibacter ambystomatis TaxID=2824561 RepID=A0A975J1T2_9BACT|nr:RsmB/NOP family class I SAM-dependent RNA methyltransferase [Luteolibacter ambystomatis]QUE52458.1 RsmB/NOP family class I SAM-dependent RNA methyltransferase [Luteolibacter ambystomatis]
MKLHRVLAEGCVAVLESVLEQGQVLDRVLETVFHANPRWGKRDRSFVAETVFEATRWKRALEFVADGSGLPALCAVQWRRMGFELPGWWAWRGATVTEMSQRELELHTQPRAIRESVPEWLDELGSAELGPRWDAELAALNQRAPIVLRVNTLLNSRDEAAKWLAGEGIESQPLPDISTALQITRGRIGKPLLSTGRIEIQDSGSQRITPVLDLEPGMRVIDACAGAGGKTLHAAALMENRGEVIALDVNGRKLQELSRRAGRAGVSIVRTQVWEPETLRDLSGWADRVLIDAPCSGLGTLRRQPDLKWRLTAPSLEKTRRLQRRLLDHYPEMLRLGGRFVYATCSILPSENEGQIALLRERDPRWQVEESLTVSPSEDGSDGLFASRLSSKK